VDCPFERAKCADRHDRDERECRRVRSGDSTAEAFALPRLAGAVGLLDADHSEPPRRWGIEENIGTSDRLAGLRARIRAETLHAQRAKPSRAQLGKARVSGGFGIAAVLAVSSPIRWRTAM
jgi:hypothetical protein